MISQICDLIDSLGIVAGLFSRLSRDYNLSALLADLLEDLVEAFVEEICGV